MSLPLLTLMFRHKLLIEVRCQATDTIPRVVVISLFYTYAAKIPTAHSRIWYRGRPTFLLTLLAVCVLGSLSRGQTRFFLQRLIAVIEVLQTNCKNIHYKVYKLLGKMSTIIVNVC